MHDAFVAAYSDPEGVAAMVKQDNIINPTTPEVAVQFFRSEQERYGRLVKQAGIEPE